MLSLERSTELNATMVTDEHLIIHAKNVCYAMGAMADYFEENREHWQAVGMLHDYDYEKYPEEHLQHTQEPLLAAGVPEEDVRAIMSHGWGICTDVKPESNMEKSLFTVDELTGIIQACARAKCDRELIQKGCDLLGMEVREVAEICIEGMRPHAAEIGLEGTGEQ